MLNCLPSQLGPVNVDIGSASRFGCDSSSDAGPDGEPDTLLHDAEPLRCVLSYINVSHRVPSH